MKIPIIKKNLKLEKSFGKDEIRFDIPLPLWKTQKEFQEIYQSVQDKSLVDEQRFFILYQLVNQTNSIEGDIAEIGVYKGGTAKLISSISNKKLYLFDTFSGMPETDSKIDIHKKGDFSDTTIIQVKEFLKDNDNVFFYPGIFPKTAKSVSNCIFSFVHVDIDIYQSAVDCCDFFYDRLSSGGIMVFDDYGWPTCPGVKKAVDDFFSDKPEIPCYLPTGQSLVIKK